AIRERRPRGQLVRRGEHQRRRQGQDRAAQRGQIVQTRSNGEPGAATNCPPGIACFGLDPTLRASAEREASTCTLLSTQPYRARSCSGSAPSTRWPTKSAYSIAAVRSCFPRRHKRRRRRISPPGSVNSVSEPSHKRPCTRRSQLRRKHWKLCESGKPTAPSHSAAAPPPGSARRSRCERTFRRSSSRRLMPVRKRRQYWVRPILDGRRRSALSRFFLKSLFTMSISPSPFLLLYLSRRA